MQFLISRCLGMNTQEKAVCSDVCQVMMDTITAQQVKLLTETNGVRTHCLARLIAAQRAEYEVLKKGFECCE